RLKRLRAKTCGPAGVVFRALPTGFGIGQTRMRPFDDQPCQALRLSTGVIHPEATAEGVTDEPVIKYVVTKKRTIEQRADPGKIRCQKICRAAMPRQINIQTGIVA